MIEILIHFFLGLAVSFAGSLPPGVISMTVTDAALRKSFRDSMTIAAAAAFMEYFQSFIAVLFSKVLMKSEIASIIIHYGAAPVFLLAGLVFLMKDKISPDKKIANTSAASGIAKGLTVGALNMFVIPFWIFWSSYLAANNWIKLEFGTIAIFSAGISAGAMLAFFLYARVAMKLASKTTILSYWGGKTLGLLFLAFGVFQFVRLFM